LFVRNWNHVCLGNFVSFWSFTASLIYTTLKERPTVWGESEDLSGSLDVWWGRRATSTTVGWTGYRDLAGKGCKMCGKIWCVYCDWSRPRLALTLAREGLDMLFWDRLA
jgi:hypothetical protein